MIDYFVKNIRYTSKEDRQSLIRIGLKRPEVQQYRISGPNRTADISNAIYALEQTLNIFPEDFSLQAAYVALQFEYPLHFATTNSHSTNKSIITKPKGYKAVNSWSH